jgi:hypothetical protein
MKAINEVRISESVNPDGSADRCDAVTNNSELKNPSWGEVSAPDPVISK